MKLYVIRHGETDCNVKGLYNGQYDEEINQNGIKQAKEAALKLQNIPFDIIISSPLKRTAHTAEILNVHSLPIIYDRRIMERDAGKYTLVPNVEFEREKFWNYSEDGCFETAETIKDFFGRIYAFLNELKENNKYDNVLIVTHGGVMRGMNTYFNGMPKTGSLTDYTKKNCEVETFEI